MSNRKVLFKAWIPVEYSKEEGSRGNRIPGTAKFEDDYSSPGKFLTWGLDIDDTASFTVAIIELPSGEVVKSDPTRIKFIG